MIRKTFYFVVVFLAVGISSYSSAATVTQLAAGYSHTLALKSDGTVWAWGRNNNGQLGNGTTTGSAAPIQVTDLSEITAVAAGDYYSVALKNNGTVWAWGYNINGQLGDGTTTQKTTPVQVSGLSGITAIAAGYRHTVALKNDGTVWTWGLNSYGQLGDGTTTQSTTPVQVPNLSEITATAAGNLHTIARKSDSTVYCWGFNDNGQLGDGSSTNKSSPVQVPELTGAAAIAAGFRHTVALKNDGTVWAWGLNSYGQLGNGSITNSPSPVQASAITGVSAVAAGYYHTAALTNTSAVYCWGYNIGGQLGDGTTTQKLTPNHLSSLSEVTAIAAGFRHTLALKSNGSVWAWGFNNYGQLGDGTTTDRHTPVQVVFNDSISPTGSVSINGGAAYTSAGSVTLTLSATDGSGTVSEMCISNNGVFDTGTWEAYATTKAWALSTGDGIKTVYVKFKNLSGNISDAVSHTITLDTTPPSVNSIVISPFMAAAGDSIQITVDAVDLAGISSVIANGVMLTKTGATTWVGNISTSANQGVNSIAVSLTDILGHSADAAGSYRTAEIVGAAGRCFTDLIMRNASERWLFRIWGKVTLIGSDPDRFYLDDGSGNKVLVIAPGYNGIDNGSYVSVRGILDVNSSPKTLTSKAEYIVRYR